MKPKTFLQKKVARLSKGLPELTEKQTAYAFQYCFKHFARRTAKGILTCTECGHQWNGKHRLADSILGCTCPNCNKKLEVIDSRKRTFKDSEYFSIMTTCKGFQVIRFFMVTSLKKVGTKADYKITEIVQRWIMADGKTETVALLRCTFQFYNDSWNINSDMEIRSHKRLDVYDINPYCTYPTRRYITEIKRSGFKGCFHDILPYDLFTAILSDNKKETLLKAGQTDMLRYVIHSSINLNDYWNSIKICVRNKYFITDASMWRDYIDLLRHFGKDTNNAKYVCPNNLKEVHDRLVNKKRAEAERKRTFEQRKKALQNEQKFRELKGRFFGISFSDGLIQIKVLESVTEYMEEGAAMRHCVFSNEYYLKENSLVLSATIDGKRIETVEISLDTLKVIQSRGVCNQNTEYHDRIISLVNDNINLIRKRLSA